MHNLRLGDLEFDPGHTVDQHRPDGFKVPDIVVEEVNDHTKHTDDSIDIKTKEGNDAFRSNDGKAQTITTTTTAKHSQNETTPPTEYLNAITWKADDFEDASFASLHNPKHVHHKPQSHGMYDEL